MSRPSRPNLIVILIDDLRFDELGFCGHPYLRTPHIDRLGHEGVNFVNAFHTTPLCSPNRASIVTGQYASRHGVIDNVGRDALATACRNYHLRLQRLGYETAHIGKWHMGNSASASGIRPLGEFPRPRQPRRPGAVTSRLGAQAAQGLRHRPPECAGAVDYVKAGRQALCAVPRAQGSASGRAADSGRHHWHACRVPAGAAPCRSVPRRRFPAAAERDDAGAGAEIEAGLRRGLRTARQRTRARGDGLRSSPASKTRCVCARR